MEYFQWCTPAAGQMTSRSSSALLSSHQTGTASLSFALPYWRGCTTETAMKRLLMITSAIGLCLAAPAFAQCTTEQEQLNRQKAAPPSTAAPAAQSQDRQQSNQTAARRPGAAAACERALPRPAHRRPPARTRKTRLRTAAFRRLSPSSAQAPRQPGPKSRSGAEPAEVPARQEQPTPAPSISSARPRPEQPAQSGQAPADRTAAFGTRRPEPTGAIVSDRRQRQDAQSARSAPTRSLPLGNEPPSLNVNINESNAPGSPPAISSTMCDL